MALKKPETICKSFTHSLTDNDLVFFCSRLHHRYQDDMAQAFDYLSSLKDEQGQENQVASLFSASRNWDEFAKNVESFSYSCMKEFDKRGYRVDQLI
jgi:hypothetical protein